MALVLGYGMSYAYHAENFSHYFIIEGESEL